MVIKHTIFRISLYKVLSTVKLSLGKFHACNNLMSNSRLHKMIYDLTHEISNMHVELEL